MSVRFVPILGENRTLLPRGEPGNPRDRALPGNQDPSLGRIVQRTAMLVGT